MTGRWSGRISRHVLEREITAIWAETLGRDDVGPHESFVELGGDSIHAMKIISRVEDLIDAELSIRVLLETRTVAGMTDHVDRMLAEERAT
ncbi:phosphopantetheine-binding protein [Streptomyces sp. NPDC053079]|uniref:phosphopantetheine-binding protein n=1 Tax=Streptomyces sp. NPDC053079 TaxID=3365697 RepID=UPI0037D548A8